MTSSRPRRLASLLEVTAEYDAVFCDVWGVVHDGVAKFAAAEEALVRFRATGRKVVLVTNSPRSAGSVIDFLDEVGVSREAYDFIATSGEVTRALIASASPLVLHIGLDAHLPLFEGLEIERVREERAETIVVTGLTKGDDDTPEAYADLLQRLAARDLPMICANPDVVAPKGDRVVWGAGALARDYAALGGRTRLAGKPFPAIYDYALRLAGNIDRSAVLAIGDGLATDIKGANDYGLDALLILAGIDADRVGGLDDVAANLVREKRCAKFVMQQLR